MDCAASNPGVDAAVKKTKVKSEVPTETVDAPQNDLDSDDEWPMVSKHVVAKNSFLKLKEPAADVAKRTSAFQKAKEAKEDPPVVSVKNKRVKKKSEGVDGAETGGNGIDFKCKLCKEVFHDKGTLEVHRKAHIRYKCCQCDQLFTSMFTLTRHAALHDDFWRLNSYICSMCAKDFRNVSSLKAHEAIHLKHDGRPRQPAGPKMCEFCWRPFPSKSMLDVHLRSHTGSKPYSCDMCDKRFSSVGNLKAHKASHVRKETGQKLFECDMCKSRFGLLGSLKSHIARHSREETHRCRLCKQLFNSKLSLDEHMWTHANEKEFVCVKCFPCRRFAKRASLLKHWKLCHEFVEPGNGSPERNNST